VIYYNYVEPVPRKISFKMEYGRKQHYNLNQKEKRRSLKKYNLIEGKRLFGHAVHSKELNFNGKLDILIETESNDGQRYFPVECKDTRKIFNNIKYQLAAYAMAIEEMTDTPVNTGYIYVIAEEKAYPIEITEDERDFVRKMVTMIHKIIDEEHYPEPRSRKRCWDCEFKRYCNDLDVPSGKESKERNLEMVRQLFGNKM
jgi:CRISPR-associated exonuclease Cas4